MSKYKAIVKVFNTKPPTSARDAAADAKALDVEVSSNSIEGLIKKVSTVIGLVEED